MNSFKKLIQCENRQMRSPMTWILVAAVLVVLAGGVRAADDNPYAALEARLGAALAGDAGVPVNITKVEETEAEGLLEVTIETGLVIYATPDGEHFVVGDLYAVRNTGLVNLAEEKRSAERKSVIDGVDIDKMIVFSPEGETRDYITVFTDVTCFYCQKLHKEVDQLNAMGIEVRYLAYPRSGLESDGARKLATAWCADNKQETLTKLKAGVALPINECEGNPIAEEYELGVALGVRGTPAIVTSSGMMIPGYKPAKDIERILGLN